MSHRYTNRVENPLRHPTDAGRRRKGRRQSLLHAILHSASDAALSGLRCVPAVALLLLPNANAQTRTLAEKPTVLDVDFSRPVSARRHAPREDNAPPANRAEPENDLSISMRGSLDAPSATPRPIAAATRKPPARRGTDRMTATGRTEALTERPPPSFIETPFGLPAVVSQTAPQT